MKKRRAIIVCICILAAAAFTLALALPKKSYAAIGRNARKHYVEYETRHSDPQDEPAKDEDDDSSEFWFPVPEGYLNKKTDEKKYVSSINPDDTPEQWDALEDAVQMREVSQIPADILETVSTDELVLYCMNYNLFDDMFVYDSMLEGFDVVKQDYDGLQLLAAREDAGTVLVNLYKAYKLNDQSQLDRSACLRLDYLETMLAQPEILAKLTDEQCRELAAECYNKATQIMNARNDEYGITQTLYLGVKSLMRADSEFARIVNGSDGARTFAETGVLVPSKISNADLGAMAARVRLVIGGGSN